MDDITVTNNQEESRFEAFKDETLLGYIDYVIDGKVMDMPHTLVFPEFEGQGVASSLTRQSLDMVRELDPEMRVIPTCPYIDVWLKRHKDYEDMRAS